MEWMLMPYRKLYALIAGRSSRKEFWMFLLLNAIVYLAFSVVLSGLAGGAASMMDVNSMQAAMLGAGVGFAAILIIPLYIWALLTSVAAVAETGVEFVALRDAVFAHASGPAQAVAEANALLDEKAPRFDG